jgi:hypothetical protein
VHPLWREEQKIVKKKQRPPGFGRRCSGGDEVAKGQEGVPRRVSRLKTNTTATLQKLYHVGDSGHFEIVFALQFSDFASVLL